MFFLLLFASLMQDGMPDGPGKDAVVAVCQDCHDLDMVTKDNKTPEMWQEAIDKMESRGAKGSKQQFHDIFAYLVKNFGRVNVNHASADEIAAGLGLSAKEAAAVVQYREANGPYYATKDLGKVIDPAKVEAQKEHIAVK